MLSLTAYFDESGHIKDPNPHFTGMSGFVAPSTIWKKVEERWSSVVCAPPYSLKGPFHMREFVHGCGQFKGWDKSQKDSLYQSLIAILVEAELVPTGCIVSTSDFESLNSNQQTLLRSSYFTALQECIRGATTQALALEPETVDMVFAEQTEYGTVEARGEDNPDNAGTTEILYYAIKRNLPIIGQYMGEYSSGSPEDLIPLQAADVLAYEMTKEYENIVNTERRIRESFKELMRLGGKRPLIKYLDRRALLTILKESGYIDEVVAEEVDETSLLQIVARHSAQHILNERRGAQSFRSTPPSWLLEEIERRFGHESAG